MRSLCDLGVRLVAAVACCLVFSVRELAASESVTADSLQIVLPEILAGQEEVVTGFIDSLPQSLRALMAAQDGPYEVGANLASDAHCAEQLPVTIANWRRIILHELLHRFDRRYGLSRRQSWRQISGWQTFNLLRPTTWDGEADNQHPNAYAEPLGTLDPSHDFITAATHYLDPNLPAAASKHLKCTMPRKYQFVAEVFDQERQQAFAAVNCPQPGRDFLADMTFTDPILGGAIPMGLVDADHVAGFEVLYATPGSDDIAEVAGHLLLRVKLRNNKRAAELGIENPHDLVISFLADTAAKSEATPSTAICKDHRAQRLPEAPFDPVAETLQAFHGLTGGLQTVFHRASLMATLYNYTIFQDRNLLRYELVLTEAEKVSLLQRLYEAKTNFKTRYFFFDSNCASVLVKIIGEGINRPRIAEFATPVIPPNSLIALLVREGVAKPVLPAFYSYRRQGLAASELLAKHIKSLTPALLTEKQAGDLIHGTVKERAKVLATLGRDLPAERQSQAALYKLAAISQYAEMKEYAADAECIQITNDAITAARDLQRQILVASVTAGKLLAATPVKPALGDILNQSQQANDRGGHNTRLMWAGLGVSKNLRRGTAGILHLGLFRQELGSSSRFAMQRTAHVRLGELTAIASDNRGLDLLRIQGLRLIKIRENLSRVPNILEEPSRIGLSLQLLDYYEDYRRDYSRLTYGSIGMVFNILSSPYYDDFLLVGMGLSLYKEWSQTRQDLKKGFQLASPLFAEGLITLGSTRRSAMRGKLAWQASAEGKLQIDPYETYLRVERSLTKDKGIVIYFGLQQDPFKERLHFNAISIGADYLPY